MDSRPRKLSRSGALNTLADAAAAGSTVANGSDDESSQHSQRSSSTTSSASPPHDLCDDRTDSEKYYNQKGNSKKILFLLCIGLKRKEGAEESSSEDEEQEHPLPHLFDIDAPPFQSLPRKNVKPARPDYAGEVSRRARLYNISPSPRPKNWTIGTSMEWLNAHPITQKRDISFLRREVAHHKRLSQEADNERQSKTARPRKLSRSGALNTLAGAAAAGSTVANGSDHESSQHCQRSSSTTSSVSPPHDLCDDRTDSEKYYNQKGNNKKILFLLCIGLKRKEGAEESSSEDEEQEHPLPHLFDIDAPPFQSLPRKNVKPARPDYAGEVSRRARLYNISPSPRPKNWTIGTSMEWLNAHPITQKRDISFLRREVAHHKRLSQEADNERQSKTANWSGVVPHLRLMFAIVEDDIKPTFISRASSRTRVELDARNSTDRPPTVSELLVSRWNDPDFNPTAPASSCHPDFANDVDCSFSKVETMPEATVEIVERQLTFMRTALLRIIHDWEASGQGDGGNALREVEDEDDIDFGTSSSDKEEAHPRGRPLTREDANFGSLQDRRPQALASRSAFLRRYPSYLLYYWELADEHQLLSSCLQLLSDEIGAADASSVSSVSISSRTSNHSRSLPTTQQAQDPLAASITGLVHALQQDLRDAQTRSIVDRIEARKRSKLDIRLRMVECINQEAREEYQTLVDELDTELDGLQQDLNDMTPVRTNRTPGTGNTTRSNVGLRRVRRRLGI